jgi:hypothetical protein
MCPAQPTNYILIGWKNQLKNVSIGLLPLLSILRGMSVYLSLSTDRQQRRQSATAQADRQQHRQSAGAVQQFSTAEIAEIAEISVITSTLCHDINPPPKPSGSIRLVTSIHLHPSQYFCPNRHAPAATACFFGSCPSMQISRGRWIRQIRTQLWGLSLYLFLGPICLLPALSI